MLKTNTSLRWFLALNLFLPLLCTAQKQGNYWYFGIKNELNFNGVVPAYQTGGQTGTNLSNGQTAEGTSVVCDSSGALLFYAEGENIWNRQHQLMQNGGGIMGGNSSTQAALIVPKPGTDHLFYVFTSDEFQNYNASGPHKGYRYSLVNMCLDNSGNGAVVTTEKNILLADSCTEKLAACRDQAGTGYWIVGHKMFSDRFQAWHLTASGLSGPITSAIGTIHGWNYTSQTFPMGPPSAQGQMKLNPQGNKLALAVSYFSPGYIELFDFNAATGVVSNPCRMVIDSAANATGYGVEFSPNGSRLYITANAQSNIRICQFDLQSGGGTCAATRASQTLVTQLAKPADTYGMQLGPDNKIYAVFGSVYTLARINFPDQPAATCIPQLSAFNLSNFVFTLPSFIAGYNYSNKIVGCAGVSNGIAQQEADEAIRLHYSGQSIQLFANEVMDEVVVRDQLSRIVYQKNAAGNSHDISVDTPGIYYLSIRCKGNIYTRKLLIQP